MSEGNITIAPLVTWDNADESIRSAGGLMAGLEATWQLIHHAIARWRAADLAETVAWQWQGQTYHYTRQALVWACLQHDIHHGGELSITLGIHGLGGLE